MLNPTKPYYKTALFLKNNSVSEKELIDSKDPIYTKILKKFDRDHIYFHKWTSFSNKGSKPTTVRMRDDNFLKKGIENKLNDTYVFFSCIKINNKKLYFILTSNYFTNYCFSTKSGNSFLRFDLSDLQNWVSNKNQIIWKKRGVKNKGKQPVYCFWVGTNKDHDYQLLNNYLNILSLIETTNYSILNTEASQKNRIKIPENVRKSSDFTYQNLCALMQNKTCFWKNEPISISKNLSKEHHHIVPEEWFFQNHNTDSKIVNDPNNIILLCDKCHSNIHSKDSQIRKQTLDNLFDSMKIVGTYDNFIDYLENKIFITLPILYKIYNCSYEE